MSQFIESIKIYDGKIFLLDYHQNRINNTFAHFGKDVVVDLAEIYKQLNHCDDGLYKLRITFDLNGSFKTQLIPYEASEIFSFQLVINNSIDYAFKYEDRTELEKMKTACGDTEVIIVKNNNITDTSFSNLLFLSGKHWFTPSTFLLNGVMRQFLLENGIIKEKHITLQNLLEYSHFQIINAMNDFNGTFIYPIERIKNLYDKIRE